MDEKIYKINRPLNINPFSIRLPLPALVSIMHRLSGIALFLALPFFLWGLQLSLESEHSFDTLQNKIHSTITQPFASLIIWLMTAAFFFHLLAGCRHLLMDCSIGDSLQGGRRGAWLVIILFLMIMIFLVHTYNQSRPIFG